MPLAALLMRYVANGRIENRKLIVYTDRGRERYEAVPRAGVVRRDHDGSMLPLSRELVDADRFLQQSARTLFDVTECAYQPAGFLGCFARCEGIDFIRILIDGERRWWIGSVIAAGYECLTQVEAKQLRDLFRQILRRFHCGYPIPGSDIGFNADGAPFRPGDSSEYQLGRWCDADCRVAATLLTKLLSLDPEFGAPEDLEGRVGDSAEWRGHVKSNVESILAFREMDYARPNVFSFVG